MRDISARELKGHNILAVERFQDNTRWMIEFSVLRPSTAYGTTEIRNMKQYLLAVLFNAPTTISNHYTAQVNHDMYAGGW